MIIVRPANTGDIPLLPGIERSAGEIFRQWPGREWIADDEVQSQEQHRALMIHGVALVAELEGHGVAGFLNGEMTEGALHIWQVAVRREHQGRGIGRALMEAAQQLAMDRGMNALTLTTFRQVPWNEPYYQRLGFIPLDRNNLPSRLKAILDAEARAGLPAARRCAMKKPL